MSDVDLDSALEALSADLPDDYDSGSSDMGDEAVIDQPDVESFTGFDPSVLPEDMQQVYKSMQADYTRKTQEVAEIRRDFEAFSESGVKPNEALEMASLFAKIDSDPAFASEFVGNITQRLEESGYGQTQAVEPASIDNNGYEGLSPVVIQELQEMRQFREQMVQNQQQQEIIAHLDTVEQTIRTTNPNYNDSDIDAIYALAHSTDGDLMAAQQSYHDIQQRLLGNYLESKTVPHGATPISTSPSSVPNREFSSLDEAHKAAMEAVRNIS